MKTKTVEENRKAAIYRQDNVSDDKSVHAQLIETKVINQKLLRAACELNLALFEAKLFDMPQAVIDANLKLRDAIAFAQEAI